MTKPVEMWAIKFVDEDDYYPLGCWPELYPTRSEARKDASKWPHTAVVRVEIREIKKKGKRRE